MHWRLDLARNWLLLLVLPALALLVPIASPAAPGKAAMLPSTLHVAVYDAAPYGARDAGGLYRGASVDLWRRVAEDRHWTYDLTLVPAMEDVIGGVAGGRFDVAIGAITITPERLERIAFSYPSHRSGTAVAMARRSGVWASLAGYGAVVGRLGGLIVLVLGLMVMTGAAIWLFERRAHKALHEGHPASHTAIGTLSEGVYWAIVTMTTVGYGDKTPLTHAGRALAVAWMLASLVLISLLSTSLVAQLTVDQIADAATVTPGDLAGIRLAAAASSSGAEYLARSALPFQPYPSLDLALAALAAGRADGVVSSVGILDWTVANRYRAAIEVRAGLLAPRADGLRRPPRLAVAGIARPVDGARHHQCRLDGAGGDVFRQVTEGSVG